MHPFSNHFARKATFVLAAAAAAGCATSTGGLPAAKGSGIARTAPAGASQSRRAVDAVSLAANLAAYGQRTNSALALATAAQLLLDNPTQVLALSPETDNSSASSQRTQKPGGQLSLDVGQLLVAAQAAGRDNSGLTSLVAQLQQRNASGSRGATFGARSAFYDLNANRTHTFRITFDGGAPASIRVLGDGDTDLDCVVYDQNDRIVAQDVDDTDFCVLDWYPKTTSQHRLVIKNWHMEIYNRYHLTTN